MKALVTGAAGFIGSYTVKALVAQGCEVVGLDNINSYYDVQLKYDRLADTGITKESIKTYCCRVLNILPIALSRWI